MAEQEIALDEEDVSLLLTGTADQQREAIGLIHHHLIRPIFAVMRRSAPSLTTAEIESAYQEVLLAVWTTACAGRWDLDWKLVPYIFGIARLKAIDAYRERRSQPASVDDVTTGVAKALSGTQMSAEWAVLETEQRQRILVAIRDEISRLPHRQRQVAQEFVDGFPYACSLEEVRKRIHANTGENPTYVSVKRAWQEAKQKIRDRLEHLGLTANGGL